MTDNDRFAMLVGVSTYDSDAYHDLPPVRADLHYMRAVLQNTEIGMYNDCAMVPEPTRAEMLHAIETFSWRRGSPVRRPCCMSTASPVTGFREELADRLQQYLAERGIFDLERAAMVGGHPVDLLFTEAGENTAVLIDTGPQNGGAPARHLRLTHARGDLLTGLPSGGYGAKACPVGRTVRVPAWRILAGEEALAPLFD